MSKFQSHSQFHSDKQSCTKVDKIDVCPKLNGLALEASSLITLSNSHFVNVNLIALYPSTVQLSSGHLMRR